jgi:plastocyanin
VHADVFTVPFDGQSLTWTLGPRSATASSDPQLSCQPISVEATIASFTFLPDPIEVPVGGTVRWTNQDGTEHTVTANDRSWTSPLLSQNQTFTRTFTDPGQFDYFCEPHPSMHGSIIVHMT